MGFVGVERFLLKLIEENTRMIQGSILIKIDGEISFTWTR